jgi:hypothetical protein
MSWHGDYDGSFGVASPPLSPAAVKAALEAPGLIRGREHDLRGTVGSQHIEVFEVSGGPQYTVRIRLTHRPNLTLAPATVAAALQTTFEGFEFTVDGERHHIQGLQVTFANVH